MTKTKRLAASLIAIVLFEIPAIAQKDGVLKHPNPASRVIDEVKEILLLMDTDKDGRITKQEWMRFMAAEFDKLDAEKSGVLDPKKLMLDKGRARPARSNDLGK